MMQERERGQVQGKIHQQVKGNGLQSTSARVGLRQSGDSSSILTGGKAEYIDPKASRLVDQMEDK